MGLFGGLFVAFSALAAGRALLPSRRVLPRSRWEESCLAYLLGAAALPLAAMAVTWAGLRFDGLTAWLLLLAALVTGLLRMKADRRRDVPLEPAPVGRAAGALLAVLGGAAVAGTLVFPLNEFDALMHFAYKGKILYYTGDVLDEAFTQVGGLFGRINTHPNYPLGVPFLEAFCAHAGAGWHDRWVQIPLAFWPVCLPAMGALALRGRGPRAASTAALLLACTPILLVRDFPMKGWPDFALAGLTGRVSLGGGADMPLAALTAAAVALLLQARQRGTLAPAVAAGLALAGGVLMKNEGLALAPVLVAAVLAGTPRAGLRNWKVLAALVLVAGSLSVPWLLHRARLPAVDENYSQLLQWDRVRFFLTRPEPPAPALATTQPDLEREESIRPVQIGRFYLNEFLNPLSWGLIWLLFWLCLPLGPGFHDGEARWLALFVLGTLLAYALIMLVTPWYLYQLRFTGIPERLMLHLLAPAAVLVARRVHGGVRPAAPPRRKGALQEPAAVPVQSGDEALPPP